MRSRLAATLCVIVSVWMVGTACGSGSGGGAASGDDGGNDAANGSDVSNGADTGSSGSSGASSGGGGDARPADAPSDVATGGDASGCFGVDGGAFPPLPPATIDVSASCPPASTCGGTLDGTYTLGSLCVTQSALFQQVTNFCSIATFTSVSATNASGVLSADNGTLTLEMHANVSAQVDFPNACTFCQCGTTLESQLGAAGVIANCSPVCNSGTCSCSIEANLDVADSGNYTKSAGTFTTSGGITLDYCAGPSGMLVADPSGALGVGSFAKDTSPSLEKCDGIDNDLDGVIDDNLRDCASCKSAGVCAMHTASCKGLAGWACNYPSTHQQTETQCDGLDNDCNGVVDDEPAADQSCASTKGAGWVCSGGACTCPGMVCGNACVDTQTNPANCGACGNACATGATCVAGNCQCPASTPDVCNGVCVNLQTDTSDCGACGTVCATGASCASGTCECPASTPNVCNGACVDEQTDQNNCGTCGNACVVACTAGACANVLHLAMGQYTSFAALSDGTARGWGDDEFGDLGNGYTTGAVLTQATIVAGLGTVAGVAHGGRCAWLASGAPYCWGENDFGEIGDGTTTMRVSPVPVSGLSQVAGMAAGSDFTCAWTPAGAAWCWGDGTSYQLGTGNTASPMVPAQVTGLSGVVQMAAGLQHTCARTSGGAVYCWGSNASGQCGSSGGGFVTTPTQVAGLANVTQLEAGSLGTCALTSAGNVYCWGDNSEGEIGDGTYTQRTAPTEVLTSVGGPALASVVQIAVGGGHACARLASGSVQCWGWNQDGELGDGTRTTSPSPVSVTVVTGVIQDLAAGGEGCCARTASGVVHCWGNDTFGEVPATVAW